MAYNLLMLLGWCKYGSLAYKTERPSKNGIQWMQIAFTSIANEKWNMRNVLAKCSNANSNIMWSERVTNSYLCFCFICCWMLHVIHICVNSQHAGGKSNFGDCNWIFRNCNLAISFAGQQKNQFEKLNCA